MTLEKMNLHPVEAVAKKLGVTTRTLQNWQKAEKIVIHKIGRNRCIDNETLQTLLTSTAKPEVVILYACGSATECIKHKAQLNTYAQQKGYLNAKIVLDIASEVDDTRPNLLRTLSVGTATKIVVLNKQNLARVGYPYIEVLLQHLGIVLECVEPS